jgi:hypothetical protein
MGFWVSDNFNQIKKPSFLVHDLMIIKGNNI